MIYTLGMNDADADVGQGIIGRTRLPMVSKMNDVSKVCKLCRKKAVIFPPFNFVKGKACVGLYNAPLTKCGCP
jgi:hypothetical protein